jgi:hypothetical protein
MKLREDGKFVFWFWKLLREEGAPQLGPSWRPPRPTQDVAEQMVKVKEMVTPDVAGQFWGEAHDCM